MTFSILQFITELINWVPVRWSVRSCDLNSHRYHVYALPLMLPCWTCIFQKLDLSCFYSISQQLPAMEGKDTSKQENTWRGPGGLLRFDKQRKGVKMTNAVFLKAPGFPFREQSNEIKLAPLWAGLWLLTSPKGDPFSHTPWHAALPVSTRLFSLFPPEPLNATKNDLPELKTFGKEQTKMPLVSMCVSVGETGAVYRFLVLSI